MQTHDTCTEEQAVALAGVSARTLQRFAESGYLTITHDAGGHARFQKRQIEEIFGALHAGISNPSAVNPAAVEVRDTGHASISPSPETDERHVEAPIYDEIIVDTAAHVSEQLRSAQSALEVERCKNLIAIQERMLDAKDDEIADLKNQRAWLRARIEKLEEKSDRDQILLLSETQTIRSLIAYQESRKSTVRQLLEWIGFSRTSALPAIGQSTSAPGSQNGRTIEVRKTANSE